MKKLLFSVLLATSALAHASGESITVYKDPNCGCCTNWVTYLRDAGYKVKTVDTADMDAIKKKYQVPAGMESCHTGILDSTGQVMEGHVPVGAIKKLVAQPGVQGVAVPGMPMNSPGMGKLDGKLTTVDFAGKPFSKD